MIEVLTKKIIDKNIFFVNKYIGWSNLNYFNFFFQFLYILFYLVSFINILILFL
jgi:hypothetical protein